jgi:transposase
VTIVAHAHPYVIGVDTHAKTHTLSILLSPNGELVSDSQFPNTTAGIARAIDWVARRTGGDQAALWVIEGAGSYGAQLARMVEATGYTVVEAAKMSPKEHRGVGKSDALDAHRIAAAVLPLKQNQLRRLRDDDGARVGLRVLLAGRDQMTGERTAAINALVALLRFLNLGIDARRPLNASQIDEVSRWRARAEDIGVATARAEAVRLAKRVISIGLELAENNKALTELLKRSAARDLLDKPGVGPVTAAVAMTAWSHHGRLRSEAAFASLAGTNPIPASSGNTIRHRLNRGGDRRLNQALHMAVVVRMRMDPDTQKYVERRLAEGQTKREIRRCLKRYLARQIYRNLTAVARADAATAPESGHPTST